MKIRFGLIASPPIDKPPAVRYDNNVVDSKTSVWIFQRREFPRSFRRMTGPIKGPVMRFFSAGG